MFARAAVAALIIGIAVGGYVIRSYYDDTCKASELTLAAEVPSYPGAEELDWRRPVPPWGPRVCKAVLKTSDPAAEVYAFYRRELQERGWTVGVNYRDDFFDYMNWGAQREGGGITFSTAYETLDGILIIIDPDG